VSAPSPPPPPADDRVGTATFVLREVLAILFVGFWLLLYAGELITGSYSLPFWFHCCGVGVMAYALGLSVGELMAYWKPSAWRVARAVVRERREE
jgi:hypothetical protein